MSGRDLEPISAFFPSIDRNLILDLDRHFRRTTQSAEIEHAEPGLEPPSSTQHEPTSHDLGAEFAEPGSVETGDVTGAGLADHERHDPSEGASRPSTSDVLEAVEQAASTMAAMDQRIRELEARQVELEANNGQLRTKLGELLQLQQAFEAKARAEGERAGRAEAMAALHLSRAQDLEGDLETALGDLTRIAEAITGSLGTLYRR